MPCGYILRRIIVNGLKILGETVIRSKKKNPTTYHKEWLNGRKNLALYIVGSTVVTCILVCL